MTGDFDICWWSNAAAQVQIQQNKSRSAHAECLFTLFISRQIACLAFKTSLQSFSLLSKYCWWCELDVGSRDVFSTESRDLAKQTFMCGTLPPMQYYPAQMKHLSLDVHISTVLKRKLDALLNGVCIPGRLVLAHLPQQRTALCIL